MSDSDRSINRLLRVEESDAPPDARLLRGLSILDEVFIKLQVPSWRDHPLVSVTEDLPGVVVVHIANPVVTHREVRISVTAFDLRVDVMLWEEAFSWSEGSYDSLQSHIVDTLVDVLSDKLEIRRFGRGLAILKFSRNNRLTYRLRIFSGLLISPFSVQEENSGLFGSPFEHVTG